MHSYPVSVTAQIDVRTRTASAESYLKFPNSLFDISSTLPRDGSFHCKVYSQGARCDCCAHMVEKNFIYSFHFKQKFAIHGHLAHDFSRSGVIRWYVYALCDIGCGLLYVGSSQKPNKRWTTHKSSCNSKNSNATGMSKHFKVGCPNDDGREKFNLEFTLIDFIDTSDEKLELAGHVPGPKCRCGECARLKNKEDEWILKLGTIYTQGLNSRDEVKSKARCTW